MKIIWTPEALHDFDSIVDYVNFQWSPSSDKKFIQLVEDKLKLIHLRPEVFEMANYKNVRRAKINMQVSLFYKEENSEVIVLRLWNNYQNPKKLTL